MMIRKIIMVSLTLGFLEWSGLDYQSCQAIKIERLLPAACGTMLLQWYKRVTKVV